MYLGACGGLFHLAVRNPILILALTLSGFVSHVSAGLPGNQLGTESILKATTEKVVGDYPMLPAQLDSIRKDFEKLEPVEPTEDQVRQVLSCLEPCSAMAVKEVLSDPATRRDASWLLYLDTYVRHGKTKADSLFNKHGPPLKK